MVYRAVLDREPTDAERARSTERLADGESITIQSDELYASTEFLGLAREICQA